MNTDLYPLEKDEKREPLIHEQSTQDQDQLVSFKSKVSNRLETQPEAIDFSVQDAEAKIQQIDLEFTACWWSVYKVWISIFMIMSCIGVILGIIYTFSQSLAFVFLVEVIGCAWNIQQLYQEYLAIEDKNMNRANKAMVSFKAFIVVIPILFILAGIIDNFEPKVIVIGFFSIVIAFYFLVVLGAQKVKAKLAQRELLKVRLEGTFVGV